jgi:glutamate racemase
MRYIGGVVMIYPRIGIPCHNDLSVRWNGLVVQAQGRAYTEAIAAAGGIPLLIPLNLSGPVLRALRESLDGILLAGGVDIAPATYGETPHENLGEVDDERDRAEWELARLALADGMPLLGICRGVQVLNVAAGGTLYQDITSQHPDALDHTFPAADCPLDHLAHQVHIAPDSRLATALGVTVAAVNSRHHQAVRDVAPEMAVVARSADGIVEGIELPTHPFAVGVQWHPENLAADVDGRRGLFEAFVAAARAWREENHILGAVVVKLRAEGKRREPVGVFDSGVGGLSVLREIARQMPHEDILYFADSAHCPYGLHPIAEVRALSTAATEFLVKQGAKLVVVACNTASAAALHHLRADFDVPIVGMEPAVKPAAERTSVQKIGVLATQVTFQGELFARLMERFAVGIDVYTQVCPGLVERIEAGQVNDPQTESLLRRCLIPMLDAGVDALVLGCTHYPFVRDIIERVVGPGVEVIDPAPAVARQTARVLDREGLANDSHHQGRVTFYTSGEAAIMAAQIERLLGIRAPVRAQPIMPSLDPLA